MEEKHLTRYCYNYHTNPMKNGQPQKTGEIAIYQSKDRHIILETRLTKDTIWLTQSQIAVLFATERSVITKHLRNIFHSHELTEKSNVQKMHIANSDKPVKFYNLDTIISVGYRVNSRRATQFRIWATNILREYIVKGYTLNQKRLAELKQKQLKEFENAVALIKKTVETKRLSASEESGLLKVITEYANTWFLLQKYDEGKISVPEKTGRILCEMDCNYANQAISELKRELMAKHEASTLFGQKRGRGLESIVGNLRQTFGGKELYPTLEEKAAHLLYFIIKDHPFTDGNKRIASFLFVIFLARNKYLLKKNGERKIDDNMLVALALLIAESDPKQKDIMIKLIINFLTD